MEFFLHLHNVGLNPLSTNNGSLWQGCLMLANYGGIHMENSTHPGRHAPEDACASSAVYDETLKAAVKVISGALTNEESLDDIGFGSSGRAPA